MKKSWKIAYIALIAISAILCVVSVIVGEYQAEVTLGVTAVYCVLFYKSCYLFANLSEECEMYLNAYHESIMREQITTNELAKMRKRCEVTEHARQELEDAYQALQMKSMRTNRRQKPAGRQ